MQLDTTVSSPATVLTWDSAFWGFPVARAVGDSLTEERVQQTDAWCHEEGIRCLYFLARPDDADTTRLAETNGFRFVDIRVTLERGLGESPLPSGAHRDGAVLMRHCLPSDLPQLRQIARESHHDTRFYYDTNFPRDRCDLLYDAWIATSCGGGAANVLVAERDGEAIGYVTCQLGPESETGQIGLIGVSAPARKGGVGQALVLAALEWFEGRGTRQVSVVTQGRNCAAQRLYQRCGFLTRAAQLWYHKWYESGGDR